MSQNKKNFKKDIRRLTGIAYERELRQHLGALFNKFLEWREGQLITWDLVEMIHKFHNGAARELYSFYQKPSDYVVAYAVSKGLISLSDVPDELHEVVEKLQDCFKKE